MSQDSLKAIQKHYDDLFIKIFGDLSADLLNSVQSATQQILDISSGFLNDDISNALNDFHNLYFNNAELDTHKESIDKTVDKIIDFIQNNEEAHPDEVQRVLSQIDNEQVAASRTSLSNLHKDMESLVVLDEDLKEHVVPILHSLQFEDQLSANLTIVTTAWQYFIGKIYSKEEYDPRALLTSIYNKLSSEKLRTIFCQQVLKTQEEFGAILQEETIEAFTSSLDADDPQHDFFVRMEKFCNNVLKWGSDDSASSVDLIMGIVETVQQKAENSGNFTDTTKEAFTNLGEIAMGFNTPHKRNSTKIMISLMQNRISANENIHDLVQPIMTAMQFQDRIRQNMENLSSMMVLWLSIRSELNEQSCSIDDQTLEDIGTRLLNNMTMASERDIIKLHIPQVADKDAPPDDEIELFWFYLKRGFKPETHQDLHQQEKHLEITIYDCYIPLQALQLPSRHTV